MSWTETHQLQKGHKLYKHKSPQGLQFDVPIEEYAKVQSSADDRANTVFFPQSLYCYFQSVFVPNRARDSRTNQLG